MGRGLRAERVFFTVFYEEKVIGIGGRGRGGRGDKEEEKGEKKGMEKG
jgi:hypothetical protein